MNNETHNAANNGVTNMGDKEINANHLKGLTVSFANKWQDGDITTSEYVKITGQLLDMAVSLDCEKEYGKIE